MRSGLKDRCRSPALIKGSRSARSHMLSKVVSIMPARSSTRGARPPRTVVSIEFEKSKVRGEVRFLVLLLNCLAAARG